MIHLKTKTNKNTEISYLSVLEMVAQVLRSKHYV